MKTPNKILDSMLVLEFRNGSKKALALLVNRWHAKMCRQAYWYVQDKEVAKDIAQEVWSVAILKLSSLKDTNMFGSWMLTIVRRKSLDHLKLQAKTQTELKGYSYDTSSNYDMGRNDAPNNHSVVLKEAIRELPIKQRQILDLFYLDEFGIHEIADILDIPSGTVKSRLFTAREKLKTIIKNRNYEK